MTKEELDKLAEKYQDDNTIIRYYGPGNGTVLEYNKTMAEVFKDGWNTCKRLMMEEAVDATVMASKCGDKFQQLLITDWNSSDGLHNGDKVRIIIVKED